MVDANANWTPPRSAVREPGTFGRRTEHSTITVQRNGVSRHYRISPLFAAACFSLVAVFMAGYLAATAYLFLRDDLIGMTQARNARLMHAYEDRIAQLRANLDKVTSRQLLDQQAIETRVAELMQRQELLTGRSSKIGKLVEAARQRGLAPDTAAPADDSAAIEETPAAPLKTGALDTKRPTNFAAMDLRGGFDARGNGDPATPAVLVAANSPAGEAVEHRTSPRKDPFAATIVASNTPGRSFAQSVFAADISNAAHAQSMFTEIKSRIGAVEQSQKALVGGLHEAAATRTRQIASILGTIDVSFGNHAEADIGGPFIPLDANADFEAHVAALDRSLSSLDAVTAAIDAVPVTHPVPGKPVSSRYGMRLDPFLKRAAMHSGTDFRARKGTPVRAAAAGKVAAAGYNGGYGKMVEIDHGNGITTRYAHLSRISVRKGDIIEAGLVIGRVGSTGRSTGPHLHYEVRRSGNAIDPHPYIKAGAKLAPYRNPAS